ncbi:outer membrane protein [Novosphingobium sp.]|uniref:outer membrane protein n=1 Tax=Novosphingobium sp. TaxID=1874826 RepID=UPI002B47639F|nr:porin family protein [Novosphingobium sp.]HKR91389.1 porin family protein [Novosphingobium sp.]
MVCKGLKVAALVAAAAVAQPSFAQDNASQGATSENGTSFRGLRVEGNIGLDRFQSEGVHNDKLGYGGTIGFDGTIGDRIVIGAEGSFWRANKWNENCQVLPDTNSICHKAFEEWGAAVRAGYLVTPDLLVFGKGGYVNGEQRRRIDSSTGTQLVYDHYRADGYQLGGGVEYTLTHGSFPVYTNVQYVYSNYHGHSARQRLTAGIGIRFK